MNFEKALSELRRLKLDPVLFAEVLLDFYPFPYQARLLRDRSKRIVACWGRQTGKSTTVAVKAIHWAYCNADQTILIVSPSHRQSLLMYARIRRLIARNRHMLRSVKRMSSRGELLLSNGSRIVALPMAEDRLRGYTANLVIVDEAAFTPEEVIIDVLMPMLAATDGTLILVGTPWSRNHIFYRAFMSDDWSVHHVSSSQCPLISRSFLEHQRKVMTDAEFRREYCAEFVEVFAHYFPEELVLSCVDPSLKLARTAHSVARAGVSGELYAGLDLGKLRDYSVLAVVEEGVDGVLTLRLLRIFDIGTPYAEVVRETVRTCVELAVKRLIVDRSGVGEAVYEELRSRVGAEGFKFSAEGKAELLANLKLLLEKRRIRLPYHRTLLRQLTSIEQRETKAGRTVLTHPPRGHDDAVMALALACWATKNKTKAAKAW